jgi:hypothetical protein
MSTTTKDREAADRKTETEDRRMQRLKLIRQRMALLDDYDPFEFTAAHKRASGFEPRLMKSAEFRVKNWEGALALLLAALLPIASCLAQAPGAPAPAEPAKAAAAEPVAVEMARSALPAALWPGYAAARSAAAGNGGASLRAWNAAHRALPARTLAVLQLDLADAMTAPVAAWQAAQQKGDARRLGAAQRLAMATALRDAEIVLQLLRPRSGAWPEVAAGIEERTARIAALRAAVASAK